MVTDSLLKLVTQTMSSLPSAVARLVYLASIRDSYTGRYQHDGWFTLATPEEVHWVVRRIHRETFESVMQLELELLCEELKGHFESIGGAVKEVAGSWLEFEPYREMMPTACPAVDRCFFISQMRTALKVLVCSPDLALLAEGCASPAPPPAPRSQLRPES